MSSRDHPPVLQAAVVRVIVLWVVGVVAGCAHYPANPKLEKYDPTVGYRFERFAPTPENGNDVFIVLTFSGGGTRAAAFSYGVLEELRKTPIGVNGRDAMMLDEVDVISSVSGGSFTSAYYALFRDRIFTDYEKGFLKRNVQSRLIWSAINPIMWIPLASPYYSRIDMAAEIYDDLVFKGKTFADLAAQPRRPYIILNSTDMSTAQRVEFTQEFFDLFRSDLSGVPVARAVAASSAFPILLCPLTINNYRIDNGYVEPSWVTDALEEREENPTRYDRAKMVRSYLTDNRPFIHLLDGGLADNIGLRGPWMSMNSTDVLDGDEGPDGASSVHGLNILRLMQAEKDRIKTLIVIVVNARPGGGTAIDQSKTTPGVVSVFDTVTGGPMGNYSSDTVQLFQKDMDQWNADQAEAKKDGEPFYPVEFFQVQLNFDGVSDPKLRDVCNGAGTNYSLTDAQVDALREAATNALRNSAKFQEILARLQRP